MKNKKLAFIDTETTGFDIEKHEIIEIGGVIVEQEEGKPIRIVDEFEIKIQPERIEDADPEALSINGYNEAEWMFALGKKQAMELFAEKTKDAVMVAHNIAFDYSFLSKAFSDTGVENKMSVLKLFWIADKLFKRNYAMPLCESSYVAMKNGPVSSELRNVIELERSFLPTKVYDYATSIFMNKGYDVVRQSKPRHNPQRKGCHSHTIGYSFYGKYCFKKRRIFSNSDTKK